MRDAGANERTAGWHQEDRGSLSSCLEVAGINNTFYPPTSIFGVGRCHSSTKLGDNSTKRNFPVNRNFVLGGGVAHLLLVVN